MRGVRRLRFKHGEHCADIVRPAMTRDATSDPDAGLQVLWDDDGPHDGPDDGVDEAADPKRRRLGPMKKVLIGLLVCVLVLAAGGWVMLKRWESQLDKQITRVEGIFEGLPNRPARTGGAATKALNVLLLGTDLRSDVQTTGSGLDAREWVPGSQRSDMMMLLHIDADREGASLTSFPRDSWVDVPGHGTTKINAAFSYGGPRLAVETIEQLTGVYVDHVAWVDWAGFSDLTDALGGVDVWVPETVTDSARDVTWTKGMHELNGEEALTYVRQRYGLPGGDFDRIRRQQYFLKSLIDGVRRTFKPTNPFDVRDLLDVITRNLTVDAGFGRDELKELLFDLTDLRSGDVDFVTVPTSGTGYEGDQSVVYIDAERATGLYRAISQDQVDGWVEKNKTASVPDSVS